MKAIHNTNGFEPLNRTVVLYLKDTEKMKAIHNGNPPHSPNYSVVLYLKDTEKMKAIHNNNSLNWESEMLCCISKIPKK